MKVNFVDRSVEDNKKQGFVSLFRSFFSWEWYEDKNVSRLFIYLLGNCNWKPKTWKGIFIDRGEIITSREALSRATNLTEQEIRTALNKLKSTNEITIKTTSKYTKITICKFKDYQTENYENNQQVNQQINQQLTNEQPASNQQLTNEQPASNQQLTTNNKDNKDYNENNLNKELKREEGEREKEEENFSLSLSDSKDLFFKKIKYRLKSKFPEMFETKVFKKDFEKLNKFEEMETEMMFDAYRYYVESIDKDNSLEQLLNEMCLKFNKKFNISFTGMLSGFGKQKYKDEWDLPKIYEDNVLIYEYFKRFYNDEDFKDYNLFLELSLKYIRGNGHIVLSNIIDDKKYYSTLSNTIKFALGLE